jgi:hypothetical protein
MRDSGGGVSEKPPLSITSVRLLFDIAKVKQSDINWLSNEWPESF